MFGTHFVFHLHGFQNEQQVARFDSSTGVNMPGNDLGLQGGTDFNHGRILRHRP